MFSSSMAHKSQALQRLLFATLIAGLCFATTASTIYAGGKRKPAKYGVIRIHSLPGGFPLELDGKSYGETTTDDRSFELEPGEHVIVVTLPDGRRWARTIGLEAGRIKCVALNYTPRPPAPPKSPCPFPVTLSAPAQVNEGEIITYTSDATYSGTSTLNYKWSVNPENVNVLGGQGTPTITVDSTGLPGQRITASLVVDDGSDDSNCNQMAQASTYIRPIARQENPAREFDVCCSCSFDDQKARLDNLAVELQNDPSASAYIIAYGGRTSRMGEAQRLGSRAHDYLVTKRSIDPARIAVVNGGYRENDCVELWIVPRGATPPQPTPTVQAGDIRHLKETPGRRRRQ